jgi:hypothetical protein
MALPPSGPITMEMINTELGYPATQIISLNDAAVRALAQMPAGMISLSDFYGKSNITAAGYRMGRTEPSTQNIINEFVFSTETASTLGITTPTVTTWRSMANLPTFARTVAFGTAAGMQSYSFPFASKTFVIGNFFTNSAGIPAPASTTGGLNFILTQRLQSSLGFTFGFGGYQSVPVSASFWNKYNYNTDSYVTQATNYTTLTPTPANAIPAQRVSWPADTVYSRGFMIRNYQQHRILFPSDTASVAANNLGLGAFPTLPRYVPYASSNTTQRGYKFGGGQDISSNYSASQDSINFATEVYQLNFVAAPVFSWGAGSWQTPTNAYYYGGVLANGPPGITPAAATGRIIRFTFSNNTYATLGATVEVGVSTGTCVQVGPVYGN